VSNINKEMKKFALEFKEECTKRGYTASICLADGLGHGEFYNNIEDVDYSMIRYIEKNGKMAIHFKAHMESNPVNTNKSINALSTIADIVGFNAINFLETLKAIEARIKVERTEGKIYPLKNKP